VSAEVLLVAALSGFVQGLSGFAFGLIATACWAWMMEPQQVVPLVVMGSLLGQSISVLSVRAEIRFSRVSPFVAGGLIGVPLGSTFLQLLSALAFRTSVGLGLLVFCSLMLRIGRFPKVHAGRFADGCIGFISGAMAGACGMGGPPMTLWCALRAWSMSVQRATFQPFFLIMQLQVIAMFVWQGLVDAELFGMFLLMAPVIVFSSWLGSHLSRRFSDAKFRQIVLLLLLLSGLLLVMPAIRYGWRWWVDIH